jgi:5-aminolevulinate synthase
MDNSSHIVPLLVGDPVKCRELTDSLLQTHGIYLQPINYPTVARGTERVRITPGPLHSEADLVVLVDALESEWKRLDLPFVSRSKLAITKNASVLDCYPQQEITVSA